VRRALRLGCFLACAAALAGCGPRLPVNREQLRAEVGKGLKKAAEKEAAPLNIQSTNSSFTVDDDKGRRIIDAKVAKMDGTVQPGTGIQGPVQFREIDCKLFQEGKPQMVLKAPAATWDGKQLVAQEKAHGVSTDGNTVIDAQKAVWTAKGGRLDLEQAKLQMRKQGKTDFTAEGARAAVENRWVTMPAGAAARNADGKQLLANNVRWHMDSGKLEADGNVRILDEGTQVTGHRLRANTQLKRGRLSGARLVVQNSSGLLKKKATR
jgi:lipopolysaccharide export system protein LptA